MSDKVKYPLDEERIPRARYNVQADLPAPLPPVLHPGTGKPAGPDDLAPLFPTAPIAREGLDRARDRDPGPGARGLSSVAPDASRRWRRPPDATTRNTRSAAFESPTRIGAFEGVDEAVLRAAEDVFLNAGMLSRRYGRDAVCAPPPG